MLYIGDPGLISGDYSPFPGTGVVGKPSVTSLLILPLVPDTGRKENLETMVSPLLPPNPDPSLINYVNNIKKNF